MRLTIAFGLAVLTTVGCSESGSSGGDGSTPAAAMPGGSPGPGGSVRFVEVASELGLDFSIDRAVAGDYFMPESMGTGCALLDYDGDGDLDVYLVNGFRDAAGTVVTSEGANRLYRQDPGGGFTDVTVEAGVGDQGYGMGVATGDIDNDGDVDLFITNYGPDALYRNNGDGTFTEVTRPAGIRTGDAGSAWSSSAGFHDLDGDGFLDLYVATYLAFDPEMQSSDGAGRLEYPAPDLFDGVPDVLYRNDGDGTFTDVTEAAGIAGAPGKGLGVLFTDLDGDGRDDVYVANDGRPNHAWISLPDGRFENRALVLGLAVNTYGRPEASMGIACGDTDADGDDEVFLTHIVQETNSLYARRGLSYADVTVAAGLGSPSIDSTGFGTGFLDADLDGDLDLAVANGRVLRWHVREGARTNAHWRPYAEPNQLFLNDGDGRFASADGEGGAFCRDIEVSRGLAVGDLDADGDLDLVVVNGNGTLRVYRNDGDYAGAWLIVRAVDPTLGRDAIGARIEVEAGGRTFHRSVRTTHSYLSASDPRTHFGLGALGADRAYDRITVTWPDGTRETFPGGPAERVVEVRRGASAMGRAATGRAATGRVATGRAGGP